MFIKWEAVDANTNKVISSDIISFEDESNVETHFTIYKKTGNIHIQPVCYIRPTVSALYPTEESTNPRDSTISISFEKDLSENCDLSGIDILCNDESVKSNYMTPVINGNIITIAAKIDNLLDVSENSTKKLTVIIPDTLFYFEDGKEIYISGQKKWSFKVDSSTTTKSDITFGVAQEKGSLVPVGNQKYSIGEKFNVEFTPNDGYRFSGWKVLAPDKTAVKSDVIYFNSSSIKTEVTVLKKINGVSIEPIVELIPKVLDNVIPVFSSTGTPSYKTIKVQFNTPISEDSFDSSFKNITITTNGSSITSYFLPPVLSSDGLQLTIKPDVSKISNIFGSNNVMDVTVSISKNIQSKLVSKAGLEEDYTWTYRINKETDDVTNPVFDDIKIYKYDLNGTKVDLVSTNYQSWNGDECKLNHIKDTIYLDVTGSDADSGIRTVKIKETLLVSPAGNARNEVIRNINPEYGNFIETRTNVFSSNFEYKLLSEEDGIIELECILYDYKDLPSIEKTIYIVKDTFISSKFSLYNDAPKVVNNQVINLRGYNNTPDDVIEVKIGKPENNIWFTKEDKSLDSEYFFSYSWGYDVNNLCTPIKLNKNELSFELKGSVNEPLENDKNIIIKLLAEDEVGNKTEFISYIPRSFYIVKVENSDKGYIKSLTINKIENIPYNSLAHHLCYKNIDIDTGEYSSPQSNYIDFSKGTFNYEVVGYNYNTTNGGTLYSSCANIYRSNDIVTDNIIKPSFDITKIGNPYSGYVNIKLISTYQSNVNYFFTYGNNDDFYDFYELDFTDKKRTSIVPFSSTNDGKECYVLAVIKNNCVQSNVTQFTAVLTKDNEPPVQSMNYVNLTSRANYSTLKNFYSYDGNYFITAGYKDEDPGIQEYEIDGKKYYKIKTYYWNNNDVVWKENGTFAAFIEQAIFTQYKNYQYKTIEQKSLKSFNNYSTLDKKFSYAYIPEIQSNEDEETNYMSAIPIKDVEDEKKVALYCIYSDKDGNESNDSIISWYGQLKTIKKNPELTVTKNNISVSIEDSERNDYEYHLVVQKIKPIDSKEIDYEWITCRAPNNFSETGSLTNTNTQLNFATDKYKKTIAMTKLSSIPNHCIEDFTNSFIKVNVIATQWVKIGTTDPVAETFHTIDPEYSYSSYIYTGNNICKSKNIQMNNGKLQIYHDRPCFVQTVCSAYDRGTDINEWERRGEKLNKQYYDNTSFAISDYEPRLNDIPQYDYYCYIVHFADGTSMMSDVYRK